MSKKKKKGITVKVIPVILTPEKVREKIVSVLEARTPIYSEDTREVAAKILEGITLVQMEADEEPVHSEGRNDEYGNPASAEPRVWERIQDVPAGVDVRDNDGNTWHWVGGENQVPGDVADTFGPFTEVIK
ncbi:hypothetical protein SEA_SIBS6_40 [Mycobacterium phage Sibs6]|nr:hypothetical protein SEA_SIBS6_40 [Mycobacterium phage Sibs6]